MAPTSSPEGPGPGADARPGARVAPRPSTPDGVRAPRPAGSRRRRLRSARTLASLAAVALVAACSTGTGTTSKSTTSTAADPSGVAMPVGDLKGWHQVFTEDFTHPLALGSWPGSYKKKWGSYSGSPDTSKVGVWNPKTTVSVSDGMADYYLHTVDGVPQCAALLPKVADQTSGRYSVRFKVDSGMTNWASAWLLWPEDDDWPAHGEMDWPEGELTGTMGAFNHYANADGGQDDIDSGTSFTSGWHTATTVWTSGKVAFYLDGDLVGTSTTQVSTYPMHWVLQSETAYGKKPAATTTGHIKIDWAVQYRQS